MATGQMNKILLSAKNDKPDTFLFIVCTVLLACILSLFDRSFSFIIPTLKQFLGCLVISSAACGIVFILLHKGAKHLLFIMIPFILCCMALEYGFRFWVRNYSPAEIRARYLPLFEDSDDLGPNSLYMPHHYTLYNCRPNLSLDNGTVHNRLGMRDHRDFIEKKENVIRIVWIGGSTTYTLGLKDNKKIFSYGLERLLNEHYRDSLDGCKIEVVNAGMGGATSAENLLRLIFFVSEISPDLVVLQQGYNDVWPRIYGEIKSDFSNYRKRWGRPENPLKEKIFHKKPLIIALLFKVQAKSMLITYAASNLNMNLYYKRHNVITYTSRYYDHWSKDNLEKNGTKYFERNTRYMISICKTMGAEALLATEPVSPDAGIIHYTATPVHNDLSRIIAEQEGVLFYDYASEMAKDVLHLPDGRHVSQIGSDLKRDLFFSYFVKNRIIPRLLERETASLVMK